MTLNELETSANNHSKINVSLSCESDCQTQAFFRVVHGSQLWSNFGSNFDSNLTSDLVIVYMVM